MSERFEKVIKDWYNNSRIVDLEYLNLEYQKPEYKVTSESNEFYCFHKNKVHHASSSKDSHLNLISDCVYLANNNICHNREQINLGNNVSLKYFHKILENLENHEKHLEILRKNQKIILNHLTQIQKELQNHKPLTKTQVFELVEEIAKQPKLVESQALELTENLKHQVEEVKRLAHDIKKYLTG